MGSTPTRPTRRKALLRTRVRDDAGWSELTVHNVSEAGMMLQGKRVPQRGTIIEIRIGEAAIVAEVRWAVGNRCGVRSRERIDVDALLNSCVLKAIERPSPSSALSAKVRNLQPEELAARNRLLGRLIDHCLLITLVVVGAIILGAMIYGFLSRPLQQVQSQLATPS